MKKLMILGASILQLTAIEKALEMGLQVIAVDMDPEAVGFKVPGVICENISSTDTENVLLAARRHEINGIMTLASDKPMRTVAVVAKALGLPGISPQTALNTTDKGQMRTVLKEHGVAVPEFYLVRSWAEYLDAVSKFEDSCIVKPVDNSGSRGVTLLLNSSSLDKKKEAYNYSKKYSDSGNILVEEYMQGPEVSVEAFSIDGVCYVIQITDKITTGPPYFVEIGHNQPSSLPVVTKNEIKDLAGAAVKATGILEGPSHTEIKLTDSGPKIVELGARLGGGFLATHLVPLSTGVDLVDSCIRLAMGMNPDVAIKHDRGSAIRFLQAEPGTIVGLEGIEEARKSENVVQVHISHSVGDKSVVLKNGNDRIGSVIARGETATEAIASCERAQEKIKIIVK